jgi:hypothetical protein
MASTPTSALEAMIRSAKEIWPEAIFVVHLDLGVHRTEA